MTKEEIQKRITKIKYLAKEAKNFEAAHIEADKLYRDFVKYLASSVYLASDVRLLATIVSSVEYIEFDRWYS